MGGEVGRLAQRRQPSAVRALGIPGADHWRHGFLEHQLGRQAELTGRRIAQRQVVLAVVEVGDAVQGRHADVDVGEMLLELAQPRDQPQRREGGEGRHVDDAAAARAADLPDGLVQPRQHGHRGGQQLGAVAGELHLAGAAQEQGAADLFLQRLDLAADGGLGQAQLLGRGPEAQQPGHRLEGAQRADRQRPLAYRLIHERMVSIPAAHSLDRPGVSQQNP
mmetsp:Transcript_5755/g.22309  ORF Transcript_5755/g.22309 Transcript_5755/m.22309 type:complete len:221 (+) Transcript_5755:2007-2669(+)